MGSFKEGVRRMVDKTIRARLLCGAVAVAAVVAVLWVAGELLRPKYLTAPEGRLTEAYYAQAAEVNHDVIFLGDCEVYETFIPAVLWETYGISAYVRGNAGQTVWQAYYLLEEALDHDAPVAVVFNVLALQYGVPRNEAYNRMALDGMAWSGSKWGAIKASMTEGETYLSYLCPLLRFHDRWHELTAEDLRYAFADPPVASDGGYLMQVGVVPAPDEVVERQPLVEAALPATAMEWLERMRVLCGERDIELILVKAPTNSWRYWWYDEWEAQITSYAVTHGLTYCNMIPHAAAMGLDLSTDTYDGGVHLNVYGAEKATRWFGRILAEEVGIPDRRGEASVAAVWAERVAIYRQRKEQMEEMYS